MLLNFTILKKRKRENTCWGYGYETIQNKDTLQNLLCKVCVSRQTPDKNGEEDMQDEGP